MCLQHLYRSRPSGSDWPVLLPAFLPDEKCREWNAASRPAFLKPSKICSISVVLKQSEPQQMQTHIPEVKSAKMDRLWEESQTKRRLQTSLQQSLKQTPAAFLKAKWTSVLFRHRQTLKTVKVFHLEHWRWLKADRKLFFAVVFMLFCAPSSTFRTSNFK